MSNKLTLFRSFLYFEEMLDEYGSYDNFLNEAASNIVDKDKFDSAVVAARMKSNKVVSHVKNSLSNHLLNYGRSLNSKEDPHEISHLNDHELHADRNKLFKHLNHLHTNDREGYNKLMSGVKKRLPISPHGNNRKTATMKGEYVDGKEVVANIANKGMPGSVNKIGKDGSVSVHSTCVNSKQSCRGEGRHNIGSACLGMTGCGAYTSVQGARSSLENLKTLKAHSKTGEHYDYGHEKVPVSPHLDYAAHEFHSILSAAKHAHNESKKTGEHKLSVYRQNTTNEGSAMHHDQILHHLPDHLKKHIATNNYSTVVAKGGYDPDNPSDASTHDGVLHNTNFSLKGPEVVHTSNGKNIGRNPSSNLKDARKALDPEHDEHGNIVRPPQNAYMVAGGHHEGTLLKYPKGEKNKKFHVDDDPKHYGPFKKLGKVKSARMYHDEVELKPGEDLNHHHPDGWGHETHYDPHTKRHRTFRYQDYHVHTNVPHPDKNGHVDFNTLNDNVGSDDRKPKGNQIRKNRNGHRVGSIHISASTSSTPSGRASGTVKVNKKGERVGDKFGVSSDPFTFPIQHHISSEDESRINLNHPKHLFDAEEHERKNKKGLSLYKYKEGEDAPQTKYEKGELK